MSVMPVRAGTSGRRMLLWGPTVAALIGAVMTVPPVVAQWSSGGRLAVSGLPEQVSAGFDQWVRSDSVTPGSQLLEAASFWQTFHITKALLALVLLAALIVAGIHIWSLTALARTSVGRGIWAVVGVLGAWMPVIAALMVIANIQGAIAPLSSVLTFLPDNATPAVEHVRTELAAGIPGPTTTALIADFRTFHAALIMPLIVVIAGLVAATVLLWVRRSRLPHEDGRPRRVLAAGGIVVPLLLPAFVLILLANLSTVADTAPALAAFYNGIGT